MVYYRNVLPITRQEAEVAFASENHQEICDAIIRVAYHDCDWRWVQKQCIRFGRHPQPEIRGLAATSLGHLVRIHGAIDLKSAHSLLNELLKDPLVTARAQDALDDIDSFYHE